MNIAETERYRAYRAEHDAWFAPEHRESEEEESLLPNGLRVRTQTYTHKGKYHFMGSMNELLDGSGSVLYTWRNLDVDGAFNKLIHHANGRDYLIFRRELYGYSVLELGTLREFHYVPSESLPLSETDAFQETFIWTDAAYDPNSSLLAVSGCFWACPYGVVLLDFSDPMAEHPWLDVHRLCATDPDWYDLYDGLDFSGWGENCVLLTAENVQTGGRETLTLSFDALRARLEEAQ